MNEKPRVLIVSKGYLPGFRYGGPVRSLSAIVERLGDELDFHILASDRDVGDTAPYSGVRQNSWNAVGKGQVYYASHSIGSILFLRRALTDIRPHIVYLNGYFSFATVLFLIYVKLGLLRGFQVLLAPRGEFSQGALAIKSSKKALFIRLTSFLRLYHRVWWQASSDVEKSEIATVLGSQVRIFIAPNLRLPSSGPLQRLPKAIGEARFVFISRLSRKKNLLHAMEMLRNLSGNISFTVYGPKSDPDYWDLCLKAAEDLPPNIEFVYGGELTHDEIPFALNQNHFLLFPTLGENFGHTIAEAFDQGLPVFISDQTPWRDLRASGVGWDIALDDHDEWQRTLMECIEMNDETYQRMSARCLTYVDQWMQTFGGVDANRNMFRAAVAVSNASKRGECI